MTDQQASRPPIAGSQTLQNGTAPPKSDGSHGTAKEEDSGEEEDIDAIVSSLEAELGLSSSPTSATTAAPAPAASAPSP
ncbi:MAG: hypothetical protein LQ340_006271, partial [Diploschistes diacapsis]